MGEGSGVGSRDTLGALPQLDEIVRIYRVDEVIFCSKDMLAQDIMSWMTRLGPAISYKIVPEESLSIIGSSSKNEPGELYTIEIQYNIAQPGQRRNKRVFDLLFSLCLLATLPLWLIFSANRHIFLKNWWAVFSGRKTWVGYIPHTQNTALPKLKPGVFTPLDELKGLHVNDDAAARLNFLFAKDWNVWRDMDVISRQWR